MRVHVVSDVHGRADALAGPGRGADALICLGDLLLFLDYADYGPGISADLFGAEATRVYVELRTAGRFDEARALSVRLLAQRDQSPASLFETAMARQYARAVRRAPGARLPDLRQRGRAPDVAEVRQTRPPRSGWRHG